MKKISVFLVALIFLGSMLVIHTGNTLYADSNSKTHCKTKMVKCPVSGEVIAKDAKKITAEYKGKTYFFCCEKCKAEFEKNPEKYVKSCTHKDVYCCPKDGCKYKSDKPGKCPKCGVELKKHECKTVYACPMKECKYKSDKPGKCPKCEMKLKKIKCDCHTKSKCGMELKKHEHKAVYVCPMKECKFKSDKPGKCPKCSTELKKVECQHHHKKDCKHKKEEKKAEK